MKMNETLGSLQHQKNELINMMQYFMVITSEKKAVTVILWHS